MTTMLLENPVNTSAVEYERRVVSGARSALMHWSPDEGVSFSLSEQTTLARDQIRQYATFLEDVADHRAFEFDLDNQQRTIKLEEHGLVQVRDSETGVNFWVSESAAFPLAFGTPTLAWAAQHDYRFGRPCARLYLNAIGLPDHANPLRVHAAWNEPAEIERLIARAHAVDTHQVELALLDSDYVRSAARVWAQNQRIREFAANLPRTAHIKHSRLARILRERHSNRGAAPSRTGSRSRGYLYIIDFPGTRTVPLIALKRFDSADIQATLNNEGLQPLSPLGTDSFWSNTVPHNQWTFWMADPSVLDSSDIDLVGWVDRTLREKCLAYSNKRYYAL